MSNEQPNYNDAELILRLYELRREPLMRESRQTIANFWPKNYDEFLAITDPKHPSNAAYRQVTSYWEMAYAFARHGITNADLMAELAGEGLFIFCRFEPYVEQFRKEVSPSAFTNVLWLIANSSFAKTRIELFRKRAQAMLAAK